jgi:hypothetical protein
VTQERISEKVEGRRDGDRVQVYVHISQLFFITWSLLILYAVGANIERNLSFLSWTRPDASDAPEKVLRWTVNSEGLEIDA